MFHKSLFFSVLLCSTLLLFNGFAQAKQTEQAIWPGAKYDPAIPTFEQVLGYDVGERISNHRAMMRYFAALQKAAPERIKLQQYAMSWEGRELIYAAVASEQNIANLDSVIAKNQALADPRKTDKAEANKIVASLPALVWLQYAVHGNEISTTDAAMYTAYHLLAAMDDPLVDQVLANTVVFIDPLQNPDGLERFTSRYYATAGMVHSADRLSAEHNEPWPRGRLNHYLFDMNRDWLTMTQPEAQGRIAALNQHLPHVIVDLHEMGGDQSYYFAPAAKPINPHMTATQIANINAIGRNNAKHFDAFGFDYFTREIFDAFYPGYGDSWPTFYGASASTYEVGSARGHVFKKSTGQLLTFRDTVQQHVVASLSTAESVAITREKLLSDFYQYQVDAIAAGKQSDERVYVINETKNRDGAHRLATLMAKHGVEVLQATEAFKACGVEYAKGSYFIDSAQPRGRFVTTTFTDQVDMSADFLKEQERRRARNLGDEIYDVTGWSLPMMFNVDVNTCNKAVRADTRSLTGNEPLAGNVSNPNATVGFVVAWGDMAAGRFLTTALRAGLTVKSADEAFVLDGKKSYPAGSLIIENRANDKNLAAQVEKIAAQTGALVDGVNTSWVTEGPSFGSDRAVIMKAPNIAIAWDEPTFATSTGNTRFVVERQLGYPVTAIRAHKLAYADLSNYHVLILPEGSYGNVLGETGAANLKKWVNAGGVLITLGRANRFAANVANGLLDVKRELAYLDDERSADTTEEDEVPGQRFTEKSDLSDSIVESETAPDYVSGALANIEVDQEHWLTAGVDKELVIVASGRDIYTPIKLDSGKNLAWFASKENLLASGYMWDENQAQLAYKPALIYQPMGKGMVIAYPHSPTLRAYQEGLNVLLTNTIFRAAAHAMNNAGY